jgi:hypothetical protein
VVRTFKVHRLAALGLAVALWLGLAVGLMAYVPVAAMAGTCGNEAARAAQASSFFPECRAYELVSPPGATAYLAPDGNIRGARAALRFSTSDGGISWFSYYPPPGLSGASMDLLSTRDSSGWKTQDVTPPQSTASDAFLGCSGYTYFSADLTKGVLADGREQCAHNEPSLVENEPEGFENLFFHDFSAGSYSLVNLTPANEAPAEALLQDASADMTHIVFSESAKLTLSAPPGEDLYEWVAGRVRLVSILPDGTAVPGRLVDSASEAFGSSTSAVGFAPFLHAVSTDGSRVIFESGGNLYEREHAEMEQSPLSPQGACLQPTMGCTVQVDASDTGGTGGGGHFIAATAQGTDIFFTDGGIKKLTSDTVPNSGQNLYEFDRETGKLTDLTPFATAQVLGLVGLGEEGSAWHLYITAEGSFGEANAEGLQPQPNAPNLYELSQGSPVAFVATLAPSDRRDWEVEIEQPASASPSGRYLAFTSVAQLTGYDNLDAGTGEPDSELFLYDSTLQRVVCVSCGPASVRPSGATGIHAAEASYATGWAPGYLRRNVFNDGRVVFDTPNALVPGDYNGRNDVYIYESGQAHLISSGTSSEGSSFAEASGLNPLTGQEGEDVFFVTSQHLLGAATGNGPALYDARVEGGFPEPPAEAPGCSGESCVGESPSTPLSSAPASATLTGLGNITPTAKRPKGCKKGMVRRHGRCVKKRHRKLKSRTGKAKRAKRTTATGRGSNV